MPGGVGNILTEVPNFIKKPLKNNALFFFTGVNNVPYPPLPNGGGFASRVAFQKYIRGKGKRMKKGEKKRGKKRRGKEKIGNG